MSAHLSRFDRESIDEILRGHGDWYSARLLRLIHKADATNRARLAEVYPEHVAAVRSWEVGRDEA